MTRWLPYAGVAFAAALVASLGTAALTARASGESVRAYLLENPEILQEVMDRLRLKQAAAQIEPLRQELESPYAGAFVGAKNPDVTLVQFFDYACGYCRASLDDIQRLVREDPKVRVVFRELPILSRESETAARASLAAAEQGRYAAFHTAMYENGPPSGPAIAEAAQAAGLDLSKLKPVMTAPRVEEELTNNVRLARALGFSGTPSWVVGDQVLNGAVGYDALKEAVAKARSAAGA